MQLKRCFLTIWMNQLDERFASMADNETAMRAYWSELEKLTSTSKFRAEYQSGALALEIAPKTGNLHVQGYLEHSRKRLTTISKDLQLNLTNAIGVVKDAQGSWNYCAGLGEYQDKLAEARITWGEPKLHGSSEKKADLKLMVNQIIDGATLTQVMKSNPYSWAVHRDRLVKFYNDWVFGIQN